VLVLVLVLVLEQEQEQEQEQHRARGLVRGWEWLLCLEPVWRSLPHRRRQELRWL
jgi:hypothetical protein